MAVQKITPCNMYLLLVSKNSVQFSAHTIQTLEPLNLQNKNGLQGKVTHGVFAPNTCNDGTPIASSADGAGGFAEYRAFLVHRAALPGRWLKQRTEKKSRPDKTPRLHPDRLK